MQSIGEYLYKQPAAGDNKEEPKAKEAEYEEIKDEDKKKNDA